MTAPAPVPIQPPVPPAPIPAVPVPPPTPAPAPIAPMPGPSNPGLTPLPDYHIIDLARGLREQHQGPRSEYQGVVRFHLRREHMRHYKDGTSTRVKWCLVGNPDLGFIDHVYKL
jgi:hypothetical protein